MREFWNARAREDAYFFVDDRLDYRDPDMARFWAGGEEDLDRLLDALGVSLSATDTALDIGCGVGRLTRVVAARAAKAYGIDVSEEMIARARQHHADLNNVEWIAGDGSTLQPLPDRSIDACVSHVVFQHIPDPEVTLGYVAEIGRVLKPGGWAAFQISNDTSVHRRRTGARALSRRLASQLGRSPRGQDDPAWLGSAVDLQRLREVALGNGLEIEQVVGEGTQFCGVLARGRGA
jgi:SAM-dependent methyltransferase